MMDETKLEALKADMSRHFISEYPREACGIITTDFKYVPCRNLSPNAKNNFILDPVALLEHEEDTWGIVHSHPGSDNPIPSEEDVASTVFDSYKFIVGFSNNFYIYWFDNRLSCLMYEKLETHHFNDQSSLS